MNRIVSRVAVAAALVLTVSGCSGGSDGAVGDSSAPTTNVVEGSTSTASADLFEAEPTNCDGTVESPEIRFVVDRCGRAVILRGVNVESSSKGDFMGDDHFPESGMEGQAALGNWGWNTVRFLVFWGAIEPTEGTYDEAYLDEVERWMDHYATLGIHVVLDMHQDLYAWKVGFDGAPDWAVDTGGLEAQPQDPDQPWYLKGADPAVQAAYQSFWNPQPGQADLKGKWLDALAHLAERFVDHPAVIGYDVMNEPAFANGDLAATLAIQADAAAGNFHNDVLTEFMQGGIDAVRSVDQDSWVFVEPTSLLNVFPYPGDLVANDLSDPREGPPRLSYAGHLYEPSVHDGAGYPTDSTYVEQWRALRSAEAAEMNASLWFGEWGGAPDQEGMATYIVDVLAMADAEMAGWAWWSWDPGGWSPIEADLTTISPNGHALLWVQPRAVAGTPTSFGWDPVEERFAMTWTERSEAVGPTEIAVPRALFADGIDVVLDGVTLDEPDWDGDRGVLLVEADRSQSSHELCIAAAGQAQRVCSAN